MLTCRAVECTAWGTSIASMSVTTQHVGNNNVHVVGRTTPTTPTKELAL
jgi:hypothetical protein